jgi:hypothetical protein
MGLETMNGRGPDTSLAISKVGRFLCSIAAAIFGAYNLFFALLDTDVPRTASEQIWMLSFAGLSGILIGYIWMRKPRLRVAFLLLCALLLAWAVASLMLDAFSLVNK